MKWIAAGLCLAFALQASGQTTSTYNTGIGHGTPPVPTEQSKLANSLPAIAIDWSYDPRLKMLNLHLVNNSNKDITAYSIAVSRKYADGSSESNSDGTPEFVTAFETDTLGALISAQEAKGTVREQIVQHDGNGVFAAGTSQNQQSPEPKEISGVTTRVDMVAYADATANVQNEQAFRRLMAQRKGQVLAMETVDEVIKRALATSTDSPISAALAELAPIFADAVVKNHSPEDPEGNQELDLQMAISNLKQMLPWRTGMAMTEREWLTWFVAEQEKRIALMSPHANLTIQ
jgi:hypothetical protein